MNRLSDRIKWEYLILFFLGLSAYIVGLFGDVFIDPSKYAAVARNIAESGDLIHPKIMGEPYLQKPPFMFWLSALFFKLFGISNLTFKLPSFLFFLIGTYATYRLGKLFYGHLTGAVGASLFAFNQAMFLFNNDTHTDTILTSLVIFSIWQFAEYLKTGKLVSYLLGFTGAGLGLITKGPVGMLIPAFAIGGHLLLKRDFKTLIHYKWIPGLFIIALIAFPVLKGLYDQFGTEGLKFFFWTNNAGRITGSFSGQSRDYFFYFHTLLYLFLPWSFFAYIVFYTELRLLIRNRFRIRSSEEFIYWSGTLIFIAILSFARMKGPHYMLPVLPLIALITAKWTIRFSLSTAYERLFSFSIRLQQVISVILLIFAVLIPSIFFPHQKSSVWIPLSLIVLFYVNLFIFFNPDKIGQFLVYSVTAIIGLNFTINAVFLPGLNQYNSAAMASEIFNAVAPDDAILYTYKYPSHETAFYAKNNSLAVTEQNRDEVFSVQGNWIFTTETGMKDIQESGINYSMIDTLPYLKISNIKLSYLMPDSRKSRAVNTYMIRINPDGFN